MCYSVLMSVYNKEKPEYLIDSITSMLNQTLKTDDFVIVCDGVLNKELDNVIEHYLISFPKIFNIIYLQENIGLGGALNIGLQHCKNEIVARMDSDDISLLDRCEQQKKIFDIDNKISIVSGFVTEFCENTLVDTWRKVPETNNQIISYSRKRNPFNHPCVMFRKSDIIEVGGYQSVFKFHEDYSLWIKLLYNSKKAYNIQKPLLKMRVSSELYHRRGGYKYYKTNFRFQKYLLKLKWIRIDTFLFNVCTRFLVQVLLPNWVRRAFYNTILHKKQNIKQKSLLMK